MVTRTPEPVQSDWAELREAQTMTQSLPKTGQAVIIGRVAHGSGVVARAYHRTLHAPSAQDPAVEDFVSAYLGQGAQ